MVPTKPYADKGEKAYDDILVFAQGRFSTLVLKGKGFGPARYKGETEPNEAEFEVEQRSSSNEIASWLGEIRNGRITGSLQWYTAGGLKISCEFSGTRR